MSSFFDKLYIKQGNKVSIITIYIYISGLEGKTYISLDETNSGTLSNGYYAFKNGTTVKLNETYKVSKITLKIWKKVI